MYFRSFNDSLPTELNDEHLQIIEAIENWQEELAERLAHVHCTQLSDRFLSYLSRRHIATLSVFPPGAE